jgi:NAD(P)H-hydrate epimerase
MGREETTGRFIARLLLTPPENGRTAAAGFIGVGNGKAKKETKKIPPIVIDADALVLMSKEADWTQKLRNEAVLTPHPGEMAALTGLSIDEIQAQRIEVARKFAQQWKQTVVLKGALTVVANKNGQVAIIPVATSALAKAGTGDVLSGMICGLMAQGLTPWDAAVTGAWIHGQAGLTASKRMGCDEAVLANDVIQSIPEVYKRIFNRE